MKLVLLLPGRGAIIKGSFTTIMCSSHDIAPTRCTANLVTPLEFYTILFSRNFLFGFDWIVIDIIRNPITRVNLHHFLCRHFSKIHSCKFTTLAIGYSFSHIKYIHFTQFCPFKLYALSCLHTDRIVATASARSGQRNPLAQNISPIAAKTSSLIA
jgi:hypothetical protein